jgi:hypothetical protein
VGAFEIEGVSEAAFFTVRWGQNTFPSSCEDDVEAVESRVAVPSPALGLAEFKRVSRLFFDKQVVEVFLTGLGVRFSSLRCLRAVWR